jgi:hypothetical protein
MLQIHGHSVTYRIAVGPYQERKIFTLQTLAYCVLNNKIAKSTIKAG